MKTIIVPSDDTAIPFERIDYPESKEEAVALNTAQFIGVICKSCKTKVNVLQNGKIVAIARTLRHTRSRRCITCHPEERVVHKPTPKVTVTKVNDTQIKVSSLNEPLEPTEFNELESLGEIQKARKDTKAVRNNRARTINEDRRIAKELGLTLEEYYSA